MPPPIAAAITRGINRRDTDGHVGAEHLMKCPAHPPRREDFRRHDETAGSRPLRPGTQGNRFLICVPEILAERLDRTRRHTESEENLTVRLVADDDAEYFG